MNDPSTTVEKFGSALVAGDIESALQLVSPEVVIDEPTILPYGGRRVPDGRAATVTLVPYHLWANRGPATMRVWLPEEA